MSYLDDPRVFLASERTLLAWIRTEISILALAFLLKKFGLDSVEEQKNALAMVVLAMCIITTILSIFSFVQSYLTMKKLGEKEIPGPMAKPLVLLGGVISIFLCIGATIIICLI